MHNQSCMSSDSRRCTRSEYKSFINLLAFTNRWISSHFAFNDQWNYRLTQIHICVAHCKQATRTCCSLSGNLQAFIYDLTIKVKV